MKILNDWRKAHHRVAKLNYMRLTPSDLLKLDPHIRAERDDCGTSPTPQRAIWYGMHACVAEGFSPNDSPGDETKAGQAVVRNLLVKADHYSPLRFAHLAIHFAGLPHDTAMQLRTHQDSAHLVQSMRYTGDRILDVIDEIEKIGATCEGDRWQLPDEAIDALEQIHYEPPAGFTYTDRYGARVGFDEAKRRVTFSMAYSSYKFYADRVRLGHPAEMARRSLPSGYRQNMSISADLQAWLHLLDQRTRADAQLECRAVAEAIMEILDDWVPEIAEWYRKNRHGKAKLAP